MKNCLFFFVVLCVWSESAFCEYFLKFTTSGATHTSGTLSANNGSWIDVSIINAISHPTDGPIHYKNSDIGALTSMLDYNGSYYFGESSTGDDKLRLYVADVPRSLTIIDSTTGALTLLTAGAGVEHFVNAPAFLLPDGLVVATGLSHYRWVGTLVKNIYLAATMPAKMISGGTTVSNFGVSDAYSKRSVDFCVQGWNESPNIPGHIEIWRRVNDSTISNTGKKCASTAMFAGKLSYIIREE